VSVTSTTSKRSRAGSNAAPIDDVGADKQQHRDDSDGDESATVERRHDEHDSAVDVDAVEAGAMAIDVMCVTPQYVVEELPPLEEFDQRVLTAASTSQSAARIWPSHICVGIAGESCGETLIVCK
jgi:hypothetical protein